MTVATSFQPSHAADTSTLCARAIETDRIYFELGARVQQLPGAVLAWVPELTASPAGAVVHRVDPAAIAELGEAWVRQTERALRDVGARMARIYCDERGAADDLLRSAGYVDRDELVFVHGLTESAPGLTLRPVRSDEDWKRKLDFHAAVHETPDGHDHRPSEWVALERMKCADGMEAFLAALDGETVGAVCAVWGDGLLRIKNLVVHSAYRRRSIGRALLFQIAAIGRERGVSEQCILAVRGDAGEMLYRSAGMQVVGTQVEWSKQL